MDTIDKKASVRAGCEVLALALIIGGIMLPIDRLIGGAVLGAAAVFCMYILICHTGKG